MCVCIKRQQGRRSVSPEGISASFHECSIRILEPSHFTLHILPPLRLLTRLLGTKQPFFPLFFPLQKNSLERFFSPRCPSWRRETRREPVPARCQRQGCVAMAGIYVSHDDLGVGEAWYSLGRDRPLHIVLSKSH
jgi:hypothetical protein